MAAMSPATTAIQRVLITPSANSDAELIRSLAPYRLPIQMSTTMVDGIVMTRVGNENTSDETGFMPLTNMWCPYTM